MRDGFIQPDWPAPENVHAYTSTRRHAQARGEFNMALHVEDDIEHVLCNRRILHTSLALPAAPIWLNQVHGRQVIQAVAGTPGDQESADADASFTLQSSVVCAVLTADCLPVLLCDEQGSCVAAIHAGWRGLQQEIIRATIECLPVAAGKLLAWLGPAIGPDAYEVDDTVHSQFVDQAVDSAFKDGQLNGRAGHWQLDLYQMARIQLRALGVQRIYGGDYCTYRNEEQFFSYRRDGQTGRMASLIWLDS